MISTASAPASRAIAVSSSVSSSLAEPVPGTNGTGSAISSAAALIAAARSLVDCADGSPVDPPSEMPCEPDSSCQRIRLRSPSVSAAPSAANGEPPGAVDPRTLAGSLRNRIGLLLSFGHPGFVGGLPALAQGVKAVDGLALGDHRRGELLLQFLLGGVPRHFHGQVRGDDDDPVAVADDDVAWRYRDAGAGDRGVDLPWDVPPPEHGRVRRAVVDRHVHGVQRLT